MSAADQNKQGLHASIALLAFACAVFFTLTILFAHIVAVELNPLSATLSQYALYDYGFVLELGFYAIGATQLLVAYLMLNNNTKRYSLSALFLTLAGLGVILVATFPTQPPPATAIERLPHILGAVMQFLFFPLAALSLTQNMKAGSRKTYTRLTGGITGVLFAIILALFVSPSIKDFIYFGLIEKIDILAINFWLIYMSYTLYKTKMGAL